MKSTMNGTAAEGAVAAMAENTASVAGGAAAAGSASAG
jgi:hypothetical protein